MGFTGTGCEAATSLLAASDSWRAPAAAAARRTRSSCGKNSRTARGGCDRTGTACNAANRPLTSRRSSATLLSLLLREPSQPRFPEGRDPSASHTSESSFATTPTFSAVKALAVGASRDAASRASVASHVEAMTATRAKCKTPSCPSSSCNAAVTPRPRDLVPWVESAARALLTIDRNAAVIVSALPFRKSLARPRSRQQLHCSSAQPALAVRCWHLAPRGRELQVQRLRPRQLGPRTLR